MKDSANTKRETLRTEEAKLDSLRLQLLAQEEKVLVARRAYFDINTGKQGINNV